MTPGNPVRIGLAGYGRGGRFFHAPLIGLAPECILAGVLTRSPPRRAELVEPTVVGRPVLSAGSRKREGGPGAGEAAWARSERLAAW